MTVDRAMLRLAAEKALAPAKSEGELFERDGCRTQCAVAMRAVLDELDAADKRIAELESEPHCAVCRGFHGRGH